MLFILLFFDCATVFRKFYPVLMKQLQFSISSIADYCYSKNLISDDTYSKIVELNVSKGDTRKLLVDVKQNISSKTEAFEDFCEVLEICEFSDLVVSLTSKTT